MPSWNELLNKVESLKTDQQKTQWLHKRQNEALEAVSSRRSGKHVILYASAFLQKPQAPGYSLQINQEDLNAFMSVMYGMDWSRGLCLVLHTPGGQTNATETLVAYIRSKFDQVEVIVPTFAMSAGTMISLGSDRIVMGRQSQLGPIDPQLGIGHRSVSARAVVDQFEKARVDVMADAQSAHVWAPVLQSLGPSLLQEAQNALDYGERMVAGWLESYMYSGTPDAATKAADTARHFNDASLHLSHGRRIARDEARDAGVVVEDLEDDQELQDAVLTAYHLATILIEKSPTVKFLVSDTKRLHVKSHVPPGQKN